VLVGRAFPVTALFQNLGDTEIAVSETRNFDSKPSEDYSRQTSYACQWRPGTPFSTLHEIEVMGSPPKKSFLTACLSFSIRILLGRCELPPYVNFISL
jgi:hypothetical protein